MAISISNSPTSATCRIRETHFSIIIFLLLIRIIVAFQLIKICLIKRRLITTNKNLPLFLRIVVILVIIQLDYIQ